MLERLREALIRGDFAPDQPLREAPLAEMFQTSRGPVREALVRLAREGLVILQPNRGATVAQLSQHDLEEVYTLRLALERLAVQCVVERATDQDLNAMEAVVKSLGRRIASISVKEDADLDIKFHDLLYRAARHERLYACWSDLRPQIYRLLLNRNVAVPDFRETTVKNHTIIVDVLRSRNAKRAVEAIEDHIRQSYVRIVGRTDSKGTDHQTSLSGTEHWSSPTSLENRSER